MSYQIRVSRDRIKGHYRHILKTEDFWISIRCPKEIFEATKDDIEFILSRDYRSQNIIPFEYFCKKTTNMILEVALYKRTKFTIKFSFHKRSYIYYVLVIRSKHDLSKRVAKEIFENFRSKTLKLMLKFTISRVRRPYDKSKR
jgi:hypothetical protein